jgi:cold shock protein
MDQMSEGTIKKKTDKGFGFINTGDGKDLFFHSTNVEGSGYEALREGQKVSYTEGRGPKGPRAENVKPI